MENRESFNIKDMNNIERIIENFPVGTHDVRAVSMRKDESTSGPTAITEQTKIQVFGANITSQNVSLNKNPTRMLHGNEVVIDITANDGYLVPITAPVVTGATGIYNRKSSTFAKLTIANPDDTVTCSIIADEPDFLCFTANEANSTVSMQAVSSDSLKAAPALSLSLEYSTDKSVWTPFVVGETTVTLANINDKVYFRGTGNAATAIDDNNYNKFVLTGSIAASGDLTTMLDKLGGITDLTWNAHHTFTKLFTGNTTLTTAPRLIATTLNYASYARLFDGCTSLTTAPELPADQLSSYCYAYMFNGCSGLTAGPDLTATTMVSGCYYSMFENCSNLETINMAEVETLANSCYFSMFNGCAKLATAPILSTDTLAPYCYGYMFRGCAALTVMPILPALVACAGCYQYMFENCTAITELSEIAVTTLADYCCERMFAGCNQLVTASITLPALEAKTGCYKNMFNGCSALTTAPTLAATTLAHECYYSMFYGCSSLAVAPVLPALTAASYCYSYMFGNCYALTAAPELPATAVADNCYSYMFLACTALTTAPEILPAEIMAPSCYYYMFRGCSGLLNVPTLPALTLAESCYRNMFSNCSSLVTATALPAMVMARKCYYAMFNACSNLEVIPALPATTLESECYRYMFQNCSKVKMSTYGGGEYTRLYSFGSTLETSTDQSCAKYMFTGTGGSFTGNPSQQLYFTANETIPQTEFPFLCFTANEAGSTVSMTRTGGPWATIYYTIDNGVTWNNLSTDDTVVTLENVGDKMYLYGDNYCFAYGVDSYNKFVMTGSIAASGDLTTLLRMQGKVSNLSNYGAYTFLGLFKDCTALTSAPELPSTTLVNDCYALLFEGCIALTTAPTLPATNLKPSCYWRMFNECASLNYVATYMTEWRDDADATESWLGSVAPIGVFKCLDDLPRESGGSRIPIGWIIEAFYHNIENQLNAYVTADSQNPTIILPDETVALRYTSETYKINSVNVTNATYSVEQVSDYEVVVTISAATDKVVVAVDVDSPEVQINCTVSPAEMGTVTGTGTYKVGYTVTLTAVPASSDYKVDKWVRGTTEYTTDSISFVATEAETVLLYMKEVTSYYQVEDVSGASYNFVLNANDYYESTNQNQHGTAALCKVIFNAGGTDMYLDCINYGENGWDYGLISKLDTALSTSSSVDDSSLVLYNFGSESSPEVKPIFITNDVVDHFIYVKYRKDGSVSGGNDSLQFKVRFENE